MPLNRGLLNLPGITPQSRACAEELLAKDFNEHHCFWGRAGFHNHLPHFLLAAYDLGAPPAVLNDIYAKDAKDLRPAEIDGSKEISVNQNNWTSYLGNEKAYAAYTAFFTREVASQGVLNTVKSFVFSPAANGNGARMLLRLIGGAAHPLIQVGYGLEFGDDLLVVSGLAQTAVHNDSTPELYVDILQDAPTPHSNGATPSDGPSLLSLLCQIYESDVLTPVMPYDPDALLSKRRTDAFQDGTRAAEIVKILSQWQLPTSAAPGFWDQKLEEIVWTVVLLLFGTSKPNRKPRLDFFVMHMVTSSLFLPTFFDKVLSGAGDGRYKAQLLQAYARTCFAYLIVRGRPRIDATSIMAATASPRPPGPAASQGQDGNPWMAIIASAIHAPEAHLPKTLRTLIYASQRYGLTQAGGVPGALDEDGREVLPGLAGVDGSLFIRCAGVMMDALGWVDHGQPEGEWDRSALGWEDAWKE